ncbi:amino acid permease C-terminal domain-containing protein [Bifidobacterium pullorum]|nr:amino acid permease C-terminal domain-containing protein [Bifidobacterium pullorum]
MSNLPATIWIRFVVWSVIGFLIYSGYGYPHPSHDGHARRMLSHIAV